MANYNPTNLIIGVVLGVVSLGFIIYAYIYYKKLQELK